MSDQLYPDNIIAFNIANGAPNLRFRGVFVMNLLDVDKVVSADIKSAIAPGRPEYLQSEAEKSLLAKVGAITAKAALGLALTDEEKSYLEEKLAFYATEVQPVRDEGNAFISAQGW